MKYVCIAVQCAVEKLINCIQLNANAKISVDHDEGGYEVCVPIAWNDL